MAREKTPFEREVAQLINPLRTARWSADYSWARLESALAGLGRDWGGLELCPDFQRGHVWTPQQQQHYIENCLRGIVPVSGLLIQFNCSTWSDYREGESDLPPGLQCLDGLQRYTAITEYVKGNVRPFGFTADDLVATEFGHKKLHVKVAVHDFTSRAELLHQYLSLNAGGTPHSAEEIERVRGLLAQARGEA